MTKEKKRTPAMQQYHDIKEKYPQGFLFFQMGDFYEMFGDDAVQASKLLGLTLTARNKGSDDPIPFAGVPIHAGERYLSELTKLGHTVVVCEQVSPAKKGTVVQRAVTRIVTPGTTLSESVLAEKEHNIIAAILEEKGQFALAWADTSTGGFWVRWCHNLEGLQGLLARLAPREVLLHKQLFSRDILQQTLQSLGTSISLQFSPKNPRKSLIDHFGEHALVGFGMNEELHLQEVAGMVLEYIVEMQQQSPQHIHTILVEREESSMHLDWQTIRNLELFSTSRDGSTSGSLLKVLDATKTAMGGRYLRHALLFPLTQQKAIQERLDQTEIFCQHPQLLQDIRRHLGNIHDIERVLGRLSLGRGNARDLVMLRTSLEEVLQTLQLVASQPTLAFTEETEKITVLYETLQQAIDDDPKQGIHEGGMIRSGFHTDLDALRSLQKDAKSLLIAYQEKEQAETGISTLKVKYTGVFGYFLEVSKSQLSKVPEHYIRKQSLVAAERYTTPELEELADKILHAEEKMVALELQLFEEIRAQTLVHSTSLQKLAAYIAELDFLSGNAAHALMASYTKPEIGTPHLAIVEGRHPVVESLLKQQRETFVANSTAMGQERFHLITGPNMAGKSTYLRQIALIAHMAHCGMYVPAKTAAIPLLDRIFTRIGAQDNLTAGQSTFMVEMQETAHILHYATDRSLIILDEIGRGTSTYDGLSIAWALMEFLHKKKALTLFATHYHELISVADALPQAANYSVAVSEQGAGILFLHAIIPGGASDSYGIDVAALAGIPQEVLASAKQHLRNLENGEPTMKKARQTDPNQLSFFQAPPPPARNPREEELLRAVRNTDPDRMTPREAHDLLYQLKDILS